MRLFILTLILLTFLNSTFSQEDNYQFKSFQSDYHEIKEGELLSNEEPWGNFNQRFEIPLGFEYHFFDTSFTSLKLETSGRIVFDDKHHYFADAFSALGLQDKGFKNKESISPISFKNTKKDGESILIIQIKNAGLKNDPQAVINLQIWLYSEQSKFELHMGECFVPDFENGFDYGPYFSIYHLKSISPLYVKQRVGSTGKNPQQRYEQCGENVNLLSNALEKLPSKGVVYSFSLNITNKL